MLIGFAGWLWDLLRQHGVELINAAVADSNVICLFVILAEDVVDLVWPSPTKATSFIAKHLTEVRFGGLFRNPRVYPLGGNASIYLPARFFASVTEGCPEQPRVFHSSSQWNNNTPDVFFSSQIAKRGTNR
jgi:hypothetical protein